MNAIHDNAEEGRFELDVDGQIVFADYARQGAVLVIYHVEAPRALRGTGAAGRLMKGIVGKARSEGLKVAPICGYASAWIRRHKHQDLVG